jgi:hypothetical protein
MTAPRFDCRIEAGGSNDRFNEAKVEVLSEQIEHHDGSLPNPVPMAGTLPLPT